MAENNKVMGIVGAIVGTILGLIVWCLIGMAGYISWVGGLALAAGAFGGYKLLGKKVDGIGVAVCIVLIIVSVYIGTRMTYAIDLHKEFQDDPEFALAFEILVGEDTDASTTEIFMNLNDYMDSYDEVMEKYNQDVRFNKEFTKDLVFGYIVTLIASVAIAAKFVKEQ